MDDQEPTAWDEINPARTALAPRPEQRVTCSERLEPASNIEFRNELTACLALVVPVGMTEEARREWLAVAWTTLSHLPSDVLAYGAKKARATCDHPSKIVPAIIRETEDWMETRREIARFDGRYALPPPTIRRDVMERRGQAMTAEDTAELNARLEKLGATARYHEDGSRYFIDQPGTA